MTTIAHSARAAFLMRVFVNSEKIGSKAHVPMNVLASRGCAHE